MFFCHPELVSGSKTWGFVLHLAQKKAAQMDGLIFLAYNKTILLRTQLNSQVQHRLVPS